MIFQQEEIFFHFWKDSIHLIWTKTTSNIERWIKYVVISISSGCITMCHPRTRLPLSYFFRRIKRWRSHRVHAIIFIRISSQRHRGWRFLCSQRKFFFDPSGAQQRNKSSSKEGNTVAKAAKKQTQQQKHQQSSKISSTAAKAASQQRKGAKTAAKKQKQQRKQQKQKQKYQKQQQRNKCS